MQQNNAQDIVVIAGILERPDGKVLIAHRAPHKVLSGLWEFPGGKVEAGETHEEALARELREEFTLKIGPIEELVATTSFIHKGSLYHMHAYKVRQFDGSFVLVDHDEVQWVRVDELDQYPFTEPDYAVIAALVK